MLETTSECISDFYCGDRKLPGLSDFTFSTRQVSHFRKLVERCGKPVIWDVRSPSPPDAGLILVADAPTSLQTEGLIRSLRSDAVVVIPFGENSAFDYLKSKLIGYGTHSASGDEGMHQLWWGGRPRQDRGSRSNSSVPLVVSGHPDEGARAIEPADITRLAASMRALKIDHVIETVDYVMPGRLTGLHKIDFIVRQWEKASRPILWVDRDAYFARRPSFFETIECDVAIHKSAGWAMATRTLYFAQTPAAEAILLTWKQLTEAYPEIWEGHLLDQAWSLVASQIELVTAWLPRDFHAPLDDAASEHSVIVQTTPTATKEPGPPQFFPNNLRGARRAGRTGAPEAQILLQLPHGDKGTLIVLVEAAGPAQVRSAALAVEKVVRTFLTASGGFGQIELSLCSGNDELAAFVKSADASETPILLVNPAEPIPACLFTNIGNRTRNAPPNRIYRATHTSSATIIQYPKSRRTLDSRHWPAQAEGLSQGWRH